MNPSIFADAVTLPRALVAPDSFRPFEWAWLDESIPTGFARQVAAHPQVLAVQTADASLTYEQLGRMANRLAACLLDRLGHDAEPVAILASSDLNAVAAMLGVLAAGKFFVAINSASAQLEMQAILEDSGARAIVTDRDGAAAASLIAVEPPGLQVFHLDELNVDRDEPLPAVPMTGATYAQIAYTSGSTGRPKGILKTHRSLLHQSMTHINGYFITPADRMMAPAPLIFGASLGIVFSALLGGATLLPIRLKSQTAAQLRDWLRDEQVTVYHSVASFFRQFAATLDTAESFPHLRIIKLGGETIQPEDIRLYQERFADHCVLRVGLASTEAGNHCWHFIGKETPSEGPTVPVGRALVGTGISLLDEHREPVAPGMVGEIAVRSAFLASGYWRNPELTQARFLPDPADSQKQIYLTGDLGRWRDDGLLEHLGRADQMVKIRGNRVEIGAVEAALLALPAISAAAVMAAAGAGGAKRLVAYLTPAATKRLTPVELRNHLQASLPDYMIPARYVWIEKMPLLPSGKIDRAALAPPSAARPDLPTPFIAPRSELEQQFVDIWAEVLELDAVGVNDNFFELGGDSILAMRMLLTVEKSLGGRVPTEFFGQPTVAHFGPADVWSDRNGGRQPTAYDPEIIGFNCQASGAFHTAQPGAVSDADRPVLAWSCPALWPWCAPAACVGGAALVSAAFLCPPVGDRAPLAGRTGQAPGRPGAHHQSAGQYLAGVAQPRADKPGRSGKLGYNGWRERALVRAARSSLWHRHGAAPCGSDHRAIAADDPVAWAGNGQSDE